MIAHPQQWWFDTFMFGYGLFMRGCYNCVHFKKHSDDSFVYLLLNVDDMLNVFKNMSKINSLKD